MTCHCSYCKEGMSKSGAECAERMAETSKCLKERIKGVDWRKVFKNMYPGIVGTWESKTLLKEWGI